MYSRLKTRAVKINDLLIWSDGHLTGVDHKNSLIESATKDMSSHTKDLSDHVKSS